jgi:DNA-binding NtrC family response regulator
MTADWHEAMFLAEKVDKGLAEFLRAIEIDCIRIALWKGETQEEAAQILGINRTTLVMKIINLGIKAENECMDILQRMKIESARLKARARYIDRMIEGV